MERLAVSGASGKTGWRIVEEALQRGQSVRALVRPDSILPSALTQAELSGRLEVHRIDLGSLETLIHALKGCTALIIATGARPSINLFGPLQVDALGVQSQLQACETVGLRRVVLVSSLCAGRWLHPLNLFGLILMWKRLGEMGLERSGLNWTVVRPGGLSEDDSRAEREGVLFTLADQQQSSSIPRRLVARVCLDVLQQPGAVGRILEITSSPAHRIQTVGEWLVTKGGC
ncbi:MAG: SDR family oxidoreductase [Cyanobacteriota bacterium]|nr:SDR family oxidoreductase [Cyanobacteriota bacterium]